MKIPENSTDNYAMAAWYLGVYDYLTEPITHKSIQHTLENYFRSTAHF